MLREPKLQPLKKADSWAADLEVPTVPNYRGRRANYRTGTASVGKRITGEVTGVGVPKRVQPGRSTARKVPGAGMRTKQVTINPDTMLPRNPGDVGKRDRRYNPEANRQRRVGIATAASGLAGAALLARGGRNIARSTQLSRKGARFAPTAGRPANVVDVDGKKKLIMLPDGILQHADDLHARGVTASRGELGQVAGGAALLGASGGMAHYGRSRANREWR